MRHAAKILSIAFILNFLWEISQAWLYAPHFVGVAGLVEVHIRASLGDVILVSLILMLDSFVFRKVLAEERLGWKRMAMIMLAGFILGVAVEKYALATGRWSYNSLMPVMPFFKVGLAPVLQMVLVPVISICIASRVKQFSKFR
ncbi:hypothetical protein EPO05_03165 [Patescibacteria group bacterium]|nr:MAG: hypothetical protein EPO05_03165 [Patescibacteria group bacterium]